MEKVEYCDIRGKRVVVRGIGKLFYQDGFPISISVSRCKERGYEVSILHVADECLKHGWSEETTLRKLTDDFSDDIDHNKYDLKLLEQFIYSSYEDQREMLFQQLFEVTTDSVRNGMDIYPLEWLTNTIAQ